MGDITAILSAQDIATRVKLDHAFAELYDELAVIARARLRRSGAAFTGTSALVHECWLRIQRAGKLAFEHEGQFLAMAATVMRSVIVDAARRAAAAQRGGTAEHLALDTSLADRLAAVPGGEPADLLALDAAMASLAACDPRLAQVVEMRFFAGMADADIARALALSERTVRRDWQRARAFLALALSQA
jgi:RNA polymerase sigma factor (TIGR02999 family)